MLPLMINWDFKYELQQNIEGIINVKLENNILNKEMKNQISFLLQIK